jgi:gliding motility-associated-like protein
VLITIDSIPTYQYNWYSPADSTTVVSSTAAWISPVLEQTSQWRLTIISPQGCINNQAGLLTIYVEEAPQPDFNHTIAANGSGYNLSCIYTGAVAASYTWSLQGPSGLVYTSTLQNPVFQVQEIGQYTIHCVATSTAGCTNELVRQVYIGPVTKPFVPTTFTPNGDGRNDIFRLRGEQFKVIQLDIIDQWGTAVFSGQTEWDGRCADGTIRNASYLYRFRFSDANQQIQELTGTVTVVQ